MGESTAIQRASASSSEKEIESKHGNALGEFIPLELAVNAEQNSAHPIHWWWVKKWAIIIVYCLFEVFVTLTSTSWLSVEYLIMERYNISTQVATLGQSMYIVGNAVGPALLGPLSDISGRKWVYVASSLVFALLMIGVARVRNYAAMVVLMFLSGAAASTGLVNVAGTIADLYGANDNAGQAMSLFVACSAIGPSLGSPIGQWVVENPHLGLDWLFWLNVIIGGVFVLVLALIPETLPRILIMKNQTYLVDEQGNKSSAISKIKINVAKEIYFVFSMALRILLTEPIVTFFGIYNGYAYGLLFLYLDGVFDVFVVNNGLSYIAADLTYLNLVAGVIVLFCYMPVQTWLYARDRAKNGGQGRPEARLLSNLVFVWLFPISLFWFAFTSNGTVSYWSPIVAGAVLGFANPLLYLSILLYITDSYPNVAASAVAAFLIPSFLLAAVFAHVGIFMFSSLSTTVAFAILAGVSVGLVALLYSVYFFGPHLRRFSKLARTT